MKISPIGIISGVAGIAVNAGVGAVVGNLIKATTPYDLNRYNKVLVGIGGFAVTGVLGDLSSKYVREQIDNVGERIAAIFHPSSETEEAVEDLKEDSATAVDSAKDVVAEVAHELVGDTETPVPRLQKGTVRRILLLDGEGVSSESIAETLDVTEEQVKYYVSRTKSENSAN